LPLYQKLEFQTLLKPMVFFSFCLQALIVKIARSGLSFLFNFYLILYFLFIELRVRVDGHRSQDIGEGIKGPRRGNVI